MYCRSSVRPNWSTSAGARSVYYVAEPVSDDDLKLMRRLDELHLELLFAGAHVFIERVWRSIKYQEVYRHAYETVTDQWSQLYRTGRAPR